MNDGGNLLVRTLLRRHARATVVLGVAVGVAAGLVTLGAVSARRGSDAVDRFVDVAARGVDAAVLTCPPKGGTPDEELLNCFTYVPETELEELDDVPGVEVLGRITAVPVAIKADPVDTYGAAEIYVPTPGRAEPDTFYPPLVDGRLPSATASDEIVLDENTVAATGLHLGDRISLTPYLAEQQTSLGDPGLEPGGTTTDAELVGVIREPATLIAVSNDNRPDDSNAKLYLSSGWLDHNPGVARWGTLTTVSTDRPLDELDGVLRETFPGYQIDVDQSSTLHDNAVVRPAKRAIELESIATWIATGLFALAACVFVGQALARQSTREWEDGPILRALSFSRREATAVAAVRALAIAGVGTIVAIAVGVVGSTLTPIGLARRADPDLGIVVDVPVLCGAIALLVAGVVISMAVPAGRALAVVTRRRVARSSLMSRASLRVAERPAAWAGLNFAGDQRTAGRTSRRAAVWGLGLAAAIAVIAAVLPASMAHLMGSPEEYGVHHDVYLGGTGDEETYADNIARLNRLTDVEAVAGVLEARAYIRGESMDLLSFAPVEGHARVSPTVLRGREAIRDDEITVGEATMRDLGLDIGDRVEMTVKAEDVDATVPVTIVGTSVMHGETENEPGRGVMVSWEAVEKAVQSSGGSAVPSALIVRFDPAHRAEGLRAIKDVTANSQLPRPQSDLRNLERISFLPAVLTALVFLLALAALAHALVLATRRHHIELGTLRAIGFTRRQTEASMLWMASALVAVALAVGMPIGWLAGQLLWHALMSGLGLDPESVTYWGVWIVVPLLTLAIGNLAALVPARRAASMSPAEALRAG